MTSESDNHSTLVSLLNGEAFSSIYTETAKQYLTKLLDEQQSIIDIPDFMTTLPHESYSSVREQVAVSATLAAILGDSRLENLLRKWTQLQQGYAKQIIYDLNSGVQEQKNQLAYFDQELKAGEAERQDYEKLSKIAVGNLSTEKLQHFAQLKVKITGLDATAKKREQLHRSMSGISKAEQTLTRLIESGIDAIHYIIPSAKQTLEHLAHKTYDGPEFIPFSVSKKITIADIFLRNAETPSIIPNDKQRKLDLTNLPPVLSELVAIYQHITAQNPGTTIIPSKIIETLDAQKIMARGLGSYLEDHAAIFGVAKRENPGSRTFTRQETGTTFDTQGLINYLLSNRLQQEDQQGVNQFYFQKALLLLREQPIAYEGFTKETIEMIAENQSLPVSGMYIARNLKKESGIKCIKLARTQNQHDVYVFDEIIPTSRQIEYTYEAVKEFGLTRFTLRELVLKVTNIHNDYRILSPVAEKVISENGEQWEVEKVCNEPIKYQTRNSPQETKKKPKAAVKDRRLM